MNNLVSVIVGLSFMAFATLTIYLGEFRESGGAIITRAQDHETFWRYVIIQIGVGFAASI
jgi:hypothetical protein